MNQFQGVPGPSHDDFNTLSNNLGKLESYQTWSTATTLSAICAYADGVSGDLSGNFPVGYMNITASVSIGLPTGGWFIDLNKQGNNRKLLTFTNIDTGEKRYLEKGDSGWATVFTSGVNITNQTETINFDTENRFVVYTNTSASSGTKPTGVTANGWLFTIVRDNTLTKLQFFHVASSSNFDIYMRTMSSGSWGAWKSITFS